jgi:hypothetical protein
MRGDEPVKAPVSVPKLVRNATKTNATKLIQSKPKSFAEVEAYDEDFDSSDVQISFIPRIALQEIRNIEAPVDAGDEVSSTFL